MSSTCSHCQQSPGSYSCSCGGVSYCGTACQRADWKRHKPSCPPYKIVLIPGKGKGMIATRKLKAGEVILEEHPLLTVEGDDPLQSPFENDLRRIRQLLILHQSLPQEQTEKILKLHDPGENSDQGGKMSFVVQTGILKEDITEESIKFVRTSMCNYLAVCDKDSKFGINAIALYDDISRVNHSCVPNCLWTGKIEDLYAKEIRALTDIEKGVEIVASYLNSNIYRRKRERKEKLKDWKIECKCKICSLEEDRLNENEELRTKILNLHEDIPKFGLRGDISNALSAAKEKLVLMEKMNDELIYDMPKTLLELYDLSLNWERITNLKGHFKKLLEEETDNYRNRAFALAKKQGSLLIDVLQDKVNELSKQFPERV